MTDRVKYWLTHPFTRRMLVGGAADSKPARSEFDSRTAHCGDNYVVGSLRKITFTSGCVLGSRWPLERHVPLTFLPQCPLQVTVFGDTTMNTLSRIHTAHLFADSTEYLALRCHWSTLVNSKRCHDLTATHHLLYLALTGRDWRRAFTLPTNQNQLANGSFVGWGLFRAIRQLHSQVFETQLLRPFEGHVTADLLQQIRSLIPLSLTYDYKLADFAPRQFPFSAYTLPVDWLSEKKAASNV